MIPTATTQARDAVATVRLAVNHLSVLALGDDADPRIDVAVVLAALAGDHSSDGNEHILGLLAGLITDLTEILTDGLGDNAPGLGDLNAVHTRFLQQAQRLRSAYHDLDGQALRAGTTTE